MKLTEVRYDDAGKGSISWFLNTFFDTNDLELDEYENNRWSAKYWLKDEFIATDSDGVRIDGVWVSYEATGDNPQPFDKESKIETWLQSTNQGMYDVKDPRNDIEIWFAKEAWPPAKRYVG